MSELNSSAPVLLITGAAGGIGSALRHLAAQRGLRLALVSRRPLQPGHAGEFCVQADVSTAEGATQALEQTVRHFGEAPALLCHAAGAVRLGAIERTSDEQLRLLMAANFDSAWFTLKAWSGSLGQTPRAAALVFSSAAAQLGTVNHAALAASKAALEGLVRSLAADWGARQWRINALALGMTETPMTQGFTQSESSRKAVSAQYPLGRLGQPSEVAEWALKLLDVDGWMTGQVIRLDGGFSAVRPVVRVASA